MDIVAITKRGRITLSEFSQLPALIDDLDKTQRAEFGRSLVKKFFGYEVSPTVANIAVDALVQIASTYKSPDDGADPVR